MTRLDHTNGLEYLGFDPSTSCLLSTHASDCANTPDAKTQNRAGRTFWPPRMVWHQKIKQKDIQHPRFPCSPLPKYWSGPTVLNFAVRMGCGAFTVVWPYDEGCGKKLYLPSQKKNFTQKKHKNGLSQEWFVFFFFSRPVHSWPFIRRSHQEHQVTKC